MSNFLIKKTSSKKYYATISLPLEESAKLESGEYDGVEVTSPLGKFLLTRDQMKNTGVRTKTLTKKDSDSSKVVVLPFHVWAYKLPAGEYNDKFKTKIYSAEEKAAYAAKFLA